MNAFSAAVLMRCPRCRKGSMYKNNNLLSFSFANSMNLECAHCKQSFEPEPGFYYGAMYMSYGLQVLLFMFLFFFFAVIGEMNIHWFVIMTFIAMLLASPYFLKLSRTLYLMLFVRFDKTL
jgi:uncharacterized protein (DUF983 family)